MLRLGFDPRAGGVDGGSALHAAAWMGHVGLVERLLARGDIGIESRDPEHESTPLGWAAFGSVHRRAKEGDYVGVIDRLVAAGANIGVPGNGPRRPTWEWRRGMTKSAGPPPSRRPRVSPRAETR
jgi:hypothetical protein